MPFPPSNRVIYERNPLQEVICQLRFPPILEISSQEPAAFQNTIRAVYPLYERDEPGIGLPKEFPREVAALLRGSGIDAPPTHKFLTEDSSRMISLSRDFVAVSDKQYLRWEKFREEVGRAVQAIEKVYNPSFYSRIGLRYRDVIDKSDLELADEKWDSLVKESLIGVLGTQEVGDFVQKIWTEASIKIDEVPGGAVTLRHGLRDDPDGGNLKYVIDADFFTTAKEAMEDVFGVLDRFNKMAGYLFRWAIKEKLHRALIPVAVE